MALANLANNITGLSLASAYTAGSSSTFVLTSGASTLPSAPFRITVITAGSYQTSSEVSTIYMVTAVNVGSQTLTVGTSSPIEGTTDRNYSIGDKVDLRLTAGSIGDLNTTVAPLVTSVSAGEVLAAPPTAAGTPSMQRLAPGHFGVSLAATVPTTAGGTNNWTPSGLTAGSGVYRLKLTVNNTGNTPTSPSSLGSGSTQTGQMPNLTGISYPSVADGQVMIIENIGGTTTAQAMTLRLDVLNSGSTALNQFVANEAYIYVNPGDAVAFDYDTAANGGSGGWVYRDRSRNLGHEFFGSGFDGNLTVPSGTTTLTRDMYYANLTINSSSGTINNAGYEIFVSEVLDISTAPAAAITRAGNAGGNGSGSTAGSGGSNFSPNTLGTNNSGAAGGAGGTTGSSWVGAAGSTSSKNGAVSANSNATGGTGGSGAGGTHLGGNGGGNPTGTAAAPLYKFRDLLPIVAGTQTAGGTGGSGGGGGGGDGTNNGGGGGGGGSGGLVAYISARTIYRGSNSTAGIIKFQGQPGGTGAAGAAGNAGGGAGGAGGAGGYVYIAYGFLAGSAITNAIDVSGGNGGTGGVGFGAGTGVGGNGGAQGNGGYVTLLNLSAGTVTQNTNANQAGTTGTAGSGVTAGLGGGQSTNTATPTQVSL